MTDKETEPFLRLDDTTIPSYIFSDAVPKEVREHLGANEKSQISSEEVGDGNLNYVFIIRGPSNSLVLKQAIPYVRCVGESWPLTRSRAYYESEFMKQAHKYVPELIPRVYFYDPMLTLTIMQYLNPPHIILRKGLIQEIVYPKLSESISDYLSQSLFKTSSLALKCPEKKKLVVHYNSNYALCQVTEQVIFTEPYTSAPLNRWTTPQLDDLAKRLCEDGDIKTAVSILKMQFQDDTQALIHGDLHSGSIMVTEETTYVFDPEFTFVGPIGFDLGTLLANLFLSYFSKEGHINATEAYKRWILALVLEVWLKFERKFINLWDTEHTGDSMGPSFYGNDTEALKKSQKLYMMRLYEDSLGFMAVEMIRRIFGVAHVEDLESIADPGLRSQCERKATEFAIEMLLNRNKYAAMQDVVNYVTK